MKPRWPPHMLPREVGLFLVAMANHDYPKAYELWDAWWREAFEPIWQLHIRQRGREEKPKREDVILWQRFLRGKPKRRKR